MINTCALCGQQTPVHNGIDLHGHGPKRGNLFAGDAILCVHCQCFFLRANEDLWNEAIRIINLKREAANA